MPSSERWFKPSDFGGSDRPVAAVDEGLQSLASDGVGREFWQASDESVANNWAIGLEFQSLEDWPIAPFLVFIEIIVH